jgi:hypothetical protein
MTNTSISERLTKLAIRAIKRSRFVALAIVATFTFAPMQPAQAQSANTWKSIAIIGGSTAAGAYIGHKVGGSTGTFVGAAVGASAGYAIDKRRRDNQYYNNDYAYQNSGYYGPYSGNNGGYYGNSDPYYGNGGYNGAPYDNGGYAHPAGYQSNDYSRNSNRCARRR